MFEHAAPDHHVMGWLEHVSFKKIYSSSETALAVAGRILRAIAQETFCQLARCVRDVEAGRGRFSLFLFQAGELAYHLDQLLFLHRLHQERGSAFFESVIPVLGPGAGGHDDDRNAIDLGLLAQQGQQLVAVGTRHLQVSD